MQVALQKLGNRDFSHVEQPLSLSLCYKARETPFMPRCQPSSLLITIADVVTGVEHIYNALEKSSIQDDLRILEERASNQ